MISISSFEISSFEIINAHQSQHCNLLLILSAENILCIVFNVHYLQIIKQKIYLFLGNLDQLSNLKFGLGICIVTFDWYLFQLINLLKPDFHCCYSFALSWVDKITTGTESFVSIFAIFVALVVEEITQSAVQVWMRSIL